MSIHKHSTDSSQRHHNPQLRDFNFGQTLLGLALGLLFTGGLIMPFPTQAAVNQPVAYQITLFLDNTSANVVSNKIERSTNGVAFTQIAQIPSATLSYQDSPLAAAGAYYYRIRSHNAAGDSGYSTIAVGITPPALIITSPAGNQVFTTPSVTIAGSAAGANGLRSVIVGGRAAALTGTNWTATATLNGGTNAIAVIASDNSSPPNLTTQIVDVVFNGTAPTPAAGFSASPTSGTTPLLVAFANTSTGSVTNQLWNFGDGATSTAANPNHTYTSAGSYAVTLTVWGPGGSNAKTVSNDITASSPSTSTTSPALTVANPTPYATVTAAALTVSGTAAGANGIQSVTVNGQSASLGGANWSTPITLASGVNTLTVVATDNSPQHNSTTLEVNVVYTPPATVTPAAGFSASPTSGTTPLLVTFANTSTGSVTNQLWNFGDGATSTAANPNHTYTSAGSYSVTLTVWGPGGSNAKTVSNDITASSPSTNSTPPALTVANPTPYETVTAAALTVSGTATDANGIQSVTVNGQSASLSSTNWSTPITLASGVNTLTVVATDNSPQHNITTLEVNVVYSPPATVTPAASFSASPTSGTTPLLVTFANTSTGSVTNQLWNFGDGATSATANPNHTYTSAGSYAVTLTVWGPGGSNAKTVSNDITASSPTTSTTPPALTVAHPTPYETVTTAALTVSGTATDANGIQHVTVNGQSASLSGANWSAPITLVSGINTLTVVATDNSPQHNITTIEVNVVYTPPAVTPMVIRRSSLACLPVVTNPLAQAGNIVVVTAGEPVAFSVQTSVPASAAFSYAWDFGDRQTSVDPEPNHIYASPNCQSYEVSVVIDDGANSATGTVQVATACRLEISKLNIRPNDTRPDADRATLTAVLDPENDFKPDGQILTIDLGHGQVAFQLDSSGHGMSEYGHCRLTRNKRMGGWSLSVTLKNGNWHDLWAAAGLTSGSPTPPAGATPVIVIVGQEAFAGQP